MEENHSVIFTEIINLFANLITCHMQTKLCIQWYLTANSISVFLSKKKDLEVEYLKHIEEKELSRKEKEAVKTNTGPDNIVAIYDSYNFTRKYVYFLLQIQA